MKFRFRLERMRNFIQLKEAVKKMETASLIQHIVQLEKKRADRAGTVRALLTNFNAQIAGGTQWVPYQTEKVQADCRELEIIERAIVEAKHELAGKKEDLARLAMRRKALNTLKDKKQQEHQVQEQRSDQKKMDEMFRLVKQK